MSNIPSKSKCWKDISLLRKSHVPVFLCHFLVIPCYLELIG